MDEIIKFAKAQISSGMSPCAAIRATTAQFVDVPRAELTEALVKGMKWHPATVRTQVQKGRRVADAGGQDKEAAKPVKEAEWNFQEVFGSKTKKAATKKAAPAEKAAARKKPAAARMVIKRKRK